MDKKLFYAALASVALLCLAFAWPSSYTQLSYWHSRGVTNPVPKVAVLDDNYAAQASFLVEGIDYGDRVWAIIDADSVAGAGGGMTFFDAVPTDSLRWSDKDLDSLTCGVELSRTTMIFYDDITD